MSKEDKNKKKENLNESPVSSGAKTSGEESGDKGHSKKDKEKHRKDESGEEKIRELKSKCEELNDKYLRLYSEFDNYRKRTQKEKIEFSKTASEDIILSLLPVLDDIERALVSTLKSSDGTEVIPKDGLQLIHQKFKSLLTQRGLEVIPSVGELFDVDFHDALTNIPAPTDDMKGKVVDEVEKGYKLHGKVIRYSKVVVGN
jgi:molecular chaperone GrpE